MGINSGLNTTRQFINANSTDLLAIFGGQEKILFHQLMEKLNEHLFEVDPITFEFEIGKTNPAVGSIGSIQKRVYQVPVDCFSPSQ